MKNKYFKLLLLLFVYFMGVKSVFAYDKYTLEDYVFFDPVSSSPCDYTNYWTPYNQNTTCYRFVVLNPNDTASEPTIKVLLDHDVDYGTYSQASTILSDLASTWTRFTGNITLADEDTIKNLMKLENYPTVTNDVIQGLVNKVPVYNLVTNMYVIKNKEVDSHDAYWLSGTTNNDGFAYVMVDSGDNSLEMKNSLLGIRPMITIQKDLVTKSPSQTNLNSIVNSATEFKFPKSAEYDGYTYNGLQGFTMANSKLVFGSFNSNNSGKGLMSVYNGNDLATFELDKYGAFGQMNGMTYNSKTNSILLVGPEGYSKVFEFDGEQFEQTNTIDVLYDKYSAIGFAPGNTSSNTDYYIGHMNRKVYFLNSDFEQVYSFDVPHYLTGQDLEYRNGYIYCTASDAGEPNNYQLYGFKANSARIYVYNAKFKRDGTPENGFGRLVKVYYIDNINKDNLGGIGTIQGISFDSSYTWLGYNASTYDSNYPYKFYRLNNVDTMISPNYYVTYDEGDLYTTVTIRSDAQLRTLAGWTLSSDKYSLSKSFNDRKSASNVKVYDDYYNTVSVPIKELTISKTDISFPDGSLFKEYSVGSFNYPAQTQSNGTISYSSSNPSTATVDGNGKVTIHAMGLTKITATITKGDGYYQGEASYILFVTKSLQELSFSESNVYKTYGDSAYTMTVTQTLGDGAISYSSDNLGVATVDNTGKVTIHGAGNAVITATAAATDGFEETSASYTLNVAKKSQTISFAQSSISKFTGAEPFSVTATLTDGDGTITYSSSNQSVATVDNNGVVTVVGGGDAVITATASETANYLRASASYSLTVSGKNAQTLTFDYTSVEKTYGDAAFTIAAHHTTGDGNVTYSSNNTSVATVDNNGKVTIKKAGDAIITATASETASFSRTTASYSLNVRKREQTINFSETSVSRKLTDHTFTLAANLTVGDGNVTYKSNDENIATVDLSGKVTFHHVGTATITAVAAESDNYLRTVASYALTVTKGEQIITKNEDTSPIKVLDTAGTYKLEVEHEVGDGKLVYSSSNEKVATIDQEALVSIVGVGSTTLTVVAEETDEYQMEVYSRVLEVVSSPSPLTSSEGDAIVEIPNTGLFKSIPIVSIVLILLGMYFLYKKEFIFTKKLSRK